MKDERFCDGITRESTKLTECCEELHDPHDDGGEVLVDGVRAGGAEDGHRVEDDGVDAAPLLEEHQAHVDEERHQDGAVQVEVKGRGRGVRGRGLGLHVLLDRGVLLAGKEVMTRPT